MIGALVALPRLAGDRRRARRPDAAGLPRLLAPHQPARPRRQRSSWRCGSSTSPTATSSGPSARPRRSTAWRRCTAPCSATSRSRSTSTSRRRGCSPPARSATPDGPQVRALDAGPGADGRVARRERRPRRGDPARPDRDHPDFAPAMVALAQILHARPIVFPGEAGAAEHLEESLALTSRAVNLDPLEFAHPPLPRLEPRHRRHPRRRAQPPRPRARPQRERPLDDHLGRARLRLRRRDRARARPRRPGPRLRHALLARRPGLRRDRRLPGRRLRRRRRRRRGRRRRDHQPAGLAGGEPDAPRRPPGAPAAPWRRFLDLALPAWTGGPRPPTVDVIDWFMGCFPTGGDAPELLELGEAALDQGPHRVEVLVDRDALRAREGLLGITARAPFPAITSRMASLS